MSNVDSERSSEAWTLIAHFGFGAAVGAVYALLPRYRNTGALYGVAVWIFSYLGWIPATRTLAPAWRHPAQRNLLMIAVHIIWGSVLAGSFKELQAAQQEIFGQPSNAAAQTMEIQEKERRS